MRANDDAGASVGTDHAANDAPQRNQGEPAMGQGTGAAIPVGKLGSLLLLAAVAVTVGLRYGDAISLQKLAEQEVELRAFQAANPAVVFGIAFTIYVLMAGFSIPGATALTLLFGWYFGWVQGVVLVSFASTAGATLAFVLSRFLLGNWVQRRFAESLATVNERFEREGTFYLFTLRLIPLMPFFVVNLLMGLTRIRTSTYWWVSQLGMLPATLLYVYAGSRVPNLSVLADDGIAAVFSPSQLLQLTVAFGLLGALSAGHQEGDGTYGRASVTSPRLNARSSIFGSTHAPLKLLGLCSDCLVRRWQIGGLPQQLSHELDLWIASAGNPPSKRDSRPGNAAAPVFRVP